MMRLCGRIDPGSGSGPRTGHMALMAESRRAAAAAAAAAALTRGAGRAALSSGLCELAALPVDPAATGAAAPRDPAPCDAAPCDLAACDDAAPCDAVPCDSATGGEAGGSCAGWTTALADGAMPAGSASASLPQLQVLSASAATDKMLPCRRALAIEDLTKWCIITKEN